MRWKRSGNSSQQPEASASNIHVIFYHYMKTNAYYSTTHPEWRQQWPNGSSITWERGVGLSPCDARWTSTYIRQVEQLVAQVEPRTKQYACLVDAENTQHSKLEAIMGTLDGASIAVIT